MWINPTGSGYSLQSLLDKSFYVNSSVYGGWRLDIDNNNLNWTVQNESVTDNGLLANIPANQWTFVAVTWYYDSTENASNKATFYINGILDSPHSYDVSEQPSGTNHLQLANLQNNDDNGTYCFNGSMHDVAVYNRVLSANEIATNFLATQFLTNNSPVPVPDKVYYKMTKGTSSTNFPILNDSSIHGGTLGYYLGAESLLWTTNMAPQPYTALHFDGGNGTEPLGSSVNGSYIAASNTTLFNFTNSPFTINVWLMPYTGGGFIVGNNSLTNSGWSLFLNNDQLEFAADNPNISGGENTIYTGTIGGWPFTAGNGAYYNMVTVTGDGTNTPLIYVNASPMATGLYGSGPFQYPATSVNILTFGVGTNAQGVFEYDGDMWQPQIWSIALSPAQIATLYLEQQSGYPWP